jgi:hypothetical protein
MSTPDTLTEKLLDDYRSGDPNMEALLMMRQRDNLANVLGDEMVFLSEFLIMCEPDSARYIQVENRLANIRAALKREGR